MAYHHTLKDEFILNKTIESAIRIQAKSDFTRTPNLQQESSSKNTVNWDPMLKPGTGTISALSIPFSI